MDVFGRRWDWIRWVAGRLDEFLFKLQKRGMNMSIFSSDALWSGFAVLIVLLMVCLVIGAGYGFVLLVDNLTPDDDPWERLCLLESRNLNLAYKVELLEDALSDTVARATYDSLTVFFENLPDSLRHFKNMVIKIRTE